jgi:RNA polymerase sigma-70 factor, ECF subfamily
VTADVSGFAEELLPVYPRLWLIAVGSVGDRAQAEDLVQDAIVIAWQKFASFQPGTNFGAWMAAIVRRCASNYVRKTRNRDTFPVDPESLDRRGTAPDSPSEAMRENPMRFVEDPYQRELDDELLGALQSLQEEARCCFLLRVVQDLTYAEIAQSLGIPEGTAMSHVHRGKLHMREWLLRLEKSHFGWRNPDKP